MSHSVGNYSEHKDIGADYGDDEREFMLAMDRYKRQHRRPFPTWKEVLDVLKGLGYRREANKPGHAALLQPGTGDSDAGPSPQTPPAAPAQPS